MIYERSINGQWAGRSSAVEYVKPGETPSQLGTTEKDITEVTLKLSSKYGESHHTARQFRVYRADNEAKIAQALEYQAKLTKQGTERKRG